MRATPADAAAHRCTIRLLSGNDWVARCACGWVSPPCSMTGANLAAQTHRRNLREEQT